MPRPGNLFAPETEVLPPCELLVECGCCGEFHPDNFTGDCRNDCYRFADEEDYQRRMGRTALAVVELEDPAFDASLAAARERQRELDAKADAERAAYFAALEAQPDPELPPLDVIHDPPDDPGEED